MNTPLSRRTLLKTAAAAAPSLLFPLPLFACIRKEPGYSPDPGQVRLSAWTASLRREGLASLGIPLGRSVARVGELATGTPYLAFTLDSYLKTSGQPSQEPLTLSLTQFDCVTLVEACLAVARVAGDDRQTWERWGREVERMRYRGGVRRGYASRLHYFSEWISDGEKRALVRDLGPELGGAEDPRPLRFMTGHRSRYPALADDRVFHEVEAIERGLDNRPRRVIPVKRIPQVVSRLETGDIVAFATEIPGLDVTHAALAYRDRSGVLRVLHAPLSGGVVEITEATLPEYVAAIRRSTGIIVARPLRA